MRMIAVFRSRMFSSTWLGTKILATLSPTDRKKWEMFNGSPPFCDARFVPIPAQGLELLNEYGFGYRYLYM